jgi:hypothetical protein
MSTWVHPRFCWRGPYCSSLNFLCSLVFFVLCVIVLWPVFPTCDLCSQPVTCVPNLWPVFPIVACVSGFSFLMTLFAFCMFIQIIQDGNLFLLNRLSSNVILTIGIDYIIISLLILAIYICLRIAVLSSAQSIE